MVRVKKDAKKPSLIVAADEIRILSEKLVLVDEDEEAGLFTYKVKVRLKIRAAMRYPRCILWQAQARRPAAFTYRTWRAAGKRPLQNPPRRSGGKLCLLTDAQLKAYSANRGNHSHICDYAGKPKSATKVIAYY